MLHPPPAVSRLVLIMVALYKPLVLIMLAFYKTLGSNGLFLIADQRLISPAGPVLIWTARALSSMKECLHPLQLLKLASDLSSTCGYVQ